MLLFGIVAYGSSVSALIDSLDAVISMDVLSPEKNLLPAD